MKYLFLTLGAPASGKSTFIKTHHLEGYTLNADEIRAILGTPKSYVENNVVTEKIDLISNDAFIWNFIRQAVHHRMKLGESIIVDATHLVRDAFDKYIEMAQPFSYKIVIIDFMADLVREFNNDSEALVNELVKRDATRSRTIGNPAVFQRYTNRYITTIDALRENTKVTVIEPDEFVEKYINPIKPIDFNEFDKIKFIGDVHGDYASLMKAFDDHKRGTAYVFVGDYLDRGTKNVETFKFLQKLVAKNIVLLRGNHEINIEKWLYNNTKAGQFGKTTLTELMKARITKKDLTEFTSRLQDYAYISFGGKNYLVTHAGMEPTEQINGFTALTDIINGVSETVPNTPINFARSPYDRDVDKAWSESNDHLPINIHGHRNNFHVETITKDANVSVNLTHPDKFRFITVTKDKTEVYNENRIDMPTFIDELFADPDVKEREIADTGIIAHNFAKDVFFSGDEKRWTPTTTASRGLFTRNDAIVGRGFAKFFNVGEIPDAKLESLVYPVNVYNKFNGFLAIAFFDKESNKTFLTTKGGSDKITKEENAEVVLDEFIQTVDNGKTKQKLDSYLKTHQDNSVLFEIISPLDPHIIDYNGEASIHPLAVVNNNSGDFVPDDETWWGIKPIAVVNSLPELRNVIQTEMQHLDEGIVLRGQNKQLKMKTPFYLKAKELRSRLDLLKSIGDDAFNQSHITSVKSRWPQKGLIWFLKARKEHATFSPKLALRYQAEDQMNKYR